MEYEAVIGLETHFQVKTKVKPCCDGAKKTGRLKICPLRQKEILSGGRMALAQGQSQHTNAHPLGALVSGDKKT